MITLQGMADNRLTIVYFFTNVFLGEIVLPPKFMTLCMVKNVA